MSEELIKECFDFILPLVKQAGKILLEAKDIEVETKEVEYDLVTIYDRKIEAILFNEIQEKYPNHKFIGEEESALKKTVSKLTLEPTWIIDPIDGTSNFTRNIPIAAVSVGLVINKQIVLGITFNPYLNELYTCIRGQGAYLNGERIRTSGVKEIGKSCFAYELSIARAEQYRDLYLYRLKHLIGVAQGIRSLGCATMSLAYVARGLIDAYQCDGLYPWDAVAGSLLVREAGGYVCDSNGTDFDLMNPNFLATATKELSDIYMKYERIADQERLANLQQYKGF